MVFEPTKRLRNFMGLSCHVIFIGLKEQIRKVCQEEYLVCGEGEEQGGAWMEKVS
jgi:hypothetical protein